MSQCPHFNFLEPQSTADWYESYDNMREQAPVYFMQEIGMWVLTRYEDIQAALLQSDVFQVGPEMTGAALFTVEEAKRIYREEGWQRYQPLSENEPKHSAYRGLIDPYLTPKYIQASEPFMHETAHKMIDQWIDDGEVDIVKGLTDYYPMTIIANIMGFPNLDIPKLHQWSYWWARPYSRGMTEEEEIRAAKEHVEMQHYIYDTIQERRKNPQEDLISYVLQAEFIDPFTKEKRDLTDEELIGLFDNCLVGGNETTTFSLTNGIYMLTKNPEIYREIESDRKRLNRFIEETLRIESPVQGLQRITTREIEIAGVTIPKGAMVHMRYGAGNLDPAKFECPYDFNLDRKNVVSHMAFSRGEHSCPGASLSRFETKVAWNALLDRLSNITASDKNSYERLPGAIFRTFPEFYIKFDKKEG